MALESRTKSSLMMWLAYSVSGELHGYYKMEKYFNVLKWHLIKKCTLLPLSRAVCIISGMCVCIWDLEFEVFFKLFFSVLLTVKYGMPRSILYQNYLYYSMRESWDINYTCWEKWKHYCFLLKFKIIGWVMWCCCIRLC